MPIPTSQSVGCEIIQLFSNYSSDDGIFEIDADIRKQENSNILADIIL